VPDLKHVQANLLAFSRTLNRFAQFIYALATSADHDTRSRGVHVDREVLRRTLDLNT